MGAIRFLYVVPHEQTMAFEAVYPEALQLDLSEKKEIWDAPGSIFVWMFVDGELAGESYGTPLANSDEPIEGLFDLTDSQKTPADHPKLVSSSGADDGRGHQRANSTRNL
jgi:hypothetical protein